MDYNHGKNDKRKLTTKDTEGRGRRNEAGKSSWSEKKSEQMMFAECRSVRNKMEAIDNEVLVEAFMKSNKTLEEAIEFFESYMKAEEEETKPASCRGRKRKASK